MGCVMKSLELSPSLAAAATFILGLKWFAVISSLEWENDLCVRTTQLFRFSPDLAVPRKQFALTWTCFWMPLFSSSSFLLQSLPKWTCMLYTQSGNNWYFLMAIYQTGMWKQCDSVKVVSGSEENLQFPFSFYGAHWLSLYCLVIASQAAVFFLQQMLQNWWRILARHDTEDTQAQCATSWCTQWNI